MAKLYKKLELIIEVDTDELPKKYPNYSSNFKHPRAFIDFIHATIRGDLPRGLSKWGYAVKIRKIEEGGTTK